MPRNLFEMGLPPFRGAVRQIIIASVAIYVVILLLMSFAQGVGQTLLALGILNPAHIREGWLWQFVTYAFMYVDPLDFSCHCWEFTSSGGQSKNALAQPPSTASFLAASFFRR